MNKAALTKQVGHLVAHTHWDREWRVPIWHARARLIRMFDSVLAAMQSNPNFKHFLFDGQVVGVDDYLEVRPEKRELMTRLILEDRIQIGPWYNLPDEYPVYGEAMVRNLLIGIRRAERYGKCLKVGYLSFGWGQTAQLPQIFAGFGIEFVFVSKRVSKARAPQSEFLWRGIDGTTLLSTRLGDEGRANFYFSTIMPAMYGVSYHDPKCKVYWGKDGWMWRKAGGAVDLETTFERDAVYHPEMLPQAIAAAWQTVDETRVPEHRFLGNGTDSTGPYELIEKLIADANAINPDRVLQQSSVNEYIAALRSALESQGLDKLNTVHGELRDGPAFAVSGNALSTRMYIKSMNRTAQLGLIRYAEPLACLAKNCGAAFPTSFIDKAWHYLLLAHSHDAINGVTLDKTARDTVYKLEQVIELAEVVTNTSAAEIIKNINVSMFKQDDVLLAVFNLSGRDNHFTAYAEIDMPEEYNPEWLDIYDSEGKACKVQPLGSRHMASPVNVVKSRALPFYCDRHQMYFQTGVVPAMGYKVFKVAPHGKLDRKTEFWNNVFDLGTQVTGPNRMANQFIEVSFNANGTFDLTDKATGRTYPAMHYFEDSGEAGDYWQRISPWKNSTFTTLASEANVYLAEDGPLVTSYVCEWTLPIPKKMLAGEHRRDDVRVPLSVVSKVTLRADTPYLEIKTTVNNPAMDHRLRACFATCIQTETSSAQGHYNVDERPVCRPFSAAGTRDYGMGTLPMQHFVDLNDKTAGFAILNRNLIEYEVSEDPSRTLFLTLLRCVPVRICTEHRCATQDAAQLGGQCLGEHTFEYAVYPHKGDVWSGGVYQAAEHYVVQPLSYQFSRHAGQGASLPLSQAMLAVEPAHIQISAFKKARDDDQLVLRLYNPTDAAVNACVKFAQTPKAVERVDLNEANLGSVAVSGSQMQFKFDPYKIVTFKLFF